MYEKFFNEIARPLKRPQWTTPNKPALELGNVLLRDFSKKSAEAPVLIIPPQAGHHSNIADYGPEQSLVETALAFKDSVFVTEWKGATPDRKNETIDDSIKA